MRVALASRAKRSLGPWFFYSLPSVRARTEKKHNAGGDTQSLMKPYKDERDKVEVYRNWMIILGVLGMGLLAGLLVNWLTNFADRMSESGQTMLASIFMIGLHTNI
jgi:hypothetical protein